MRSLLERSSFIAATKSTLCMFVEENGRKVLGGPFNQPIPRVPLGSARALPIDPNHNLPIRDDHRIAMDDLHSTSSWCSFLRLSHVVERNIIARNEMPISWCGCKMESFYRKALGWHFIGLSAFVSCLLIDGCPVEVPLLYYRCKKRWL